MRLRNCLGHHVPVLSSELERVGVDKVGCTGDLLAIERVGHRQVNPVNEGALRVKFEHTYGFMSKTKSRCTINLTWWWEVRRQEGVQIRGYVITLGPFSQTQNFCRNYFTDFGPLYQHTEYYQ